MPQIISGQILCYYYSYKHSKNAKKKMYTHFLIEFLNSGKVIAGLSWSWASENVAFYLGVI